MVPLVYVCSFIPALEVNRTTTYIVCMVERREALYHVLDLTLWDYHSSMPIWALTLVSKDVSQIARNYSMRRLKVVHIYDEFSFMKGDVVSRVLAGWDASSLVR